jgi:flagellar biosynthesis protein FlhF
MSQTDVRTFKAASMQEALDIVRREMGPDAVILHTREMPQPRFLKWRKATERVEITAGSGVNVRTPQALLSSSANRGGAALNPAAKRHRDEYLAPPPALLPSSTPGLQRMPFEVRAGQRAVSQVARSAAYMPEVPAAPVSWPSPVVAAPPAREAAAATEQQASIARQLSTIQQMMAQLTRGSAPKADEIPAELFQLYTELIDVEVEEELARELVHQLKQNPGSDSLSDAPAAKARLRSMVEQEVHCTAPITPVPGQRRVVALVGPTGVGKTTTIAKLAANFRLRDGIRMGLVTVDTYRIAAVEQLRTYAEIIDLPMKVVTSPREMRRALDELSGLDLVLIDTAGRSPRDELKIQELKSLLAEARVDEVHLVLSLAASPRNLQATAEKFAPAGTTAMILTKLDEAVGMGSLLSVARRVPLPVSYLTTGQDVPDDIEHASARRVARLVLGEESLFGRRKSA